MTAKGDLPTKPCEQCARPFAWRRKWAKGWDEVRYCSERCRGEAARARRHARAEAGSPTAPQGERRSA